jgi:hypothetical protein
MTVIKFQTAKEQAFAELLVEAEKMEYRWAIRVDDNEIKSPEKMAGKVLNFPVPRS